jgi:hypothetical protein
MFIKILCLMVLCLSILVNALYFLMPRFGKASKYDLPILIISIIIGTLCAYVVIK